MIRYPHEKNNTNFRAYEAQSFNDCINDLCLLEIPLLDRTYTWSNKCNNPTLERLDRVFINLTWDDVFPSTTLYSLTRTTSDHVPLKIDISTTIPKSRLFCFENYWIQCPGFIDVISAAWCCSTSSAEAAAILSTKLKGTRRALKHWKGRKNNLSQQETDCRIVINLLDRVEEIRPLSTQEANLRSLVVTILSRVTQAKFVLWKQRSKVWAAIEGDENTRYFHACANQRHRHNKIQIIEHDGRELSNHEHKAAVERKSRS